MELNYSELIKRDVINVSDGRCLGRIIDVRFSFPKGILVGIIVPGKRRGLFSFFDKSEIYIDRSRIIKIGGDVILVDLKINDAYAPISDTQEQNARPPCPPPPCSYPCNPCAPNKKDNEFKQFASMCENIDMSDY